VPKLLYDALSHVNIYPDIESELSSSSRFRDIMHGVPKMGAGRGGTENAGVENAGVEISARNSKKRQGVENAGVKMRVEN